MKDFPGLDQQDMEQLLLMIETSLEVNKRFQFFLWAQGALQRFLPHETLVCAHGDIGKLRFEHENFSSSLFDAQKERALGDPAHGLLPRLADAWLRSGCKPQIGCPPVVLGTDGKPRDFGHVVAHGPSEIQGPQSSFFVFLGLPNAPGHRENYLLELLMPYLHMALYRMLASEGVAKPAEVTAKGVLSLREIQVLQWVKNGKTNEEISAILRISPPTVKNHVQRILRKLNVSNRAQAVGRAVALRLLQSDFPAA